MNMTETYNLVDEFIRLVDTAGVSDFTVPPFSFDLIVGFSFRGNSIMPAKAPASSAGAFAERKR